MAPPSLAPTPLALLPPPHPPVRSPAPDGRLSPPPHTHLRPPPSTPPLCCYVVPEPMDPVAAVTPPPPLPPLPPPPPSPMEVIAPPPHPSIPIRGAQPGQLLHGAFSSPSREGFRVAGGQHAPAVPLSAPSVPPPLGPSTRRRKRYSSQSQSCDVDGKIMYCKQQSKGTIQDEGDQSRM
ncbi:protein enabled homolog [Schistocerca americana]|uniref:protein enabled homolog n=1 Tax=Schistocerca americana TaxID=7009 RepID=UPI001F4F4C70|nr:protein enabled homolog [Schistocerca americana]